MKASADLITLSRCRPPLQDRGGAGFLGPLSVPGSKSITNRALLLAALAPGPSTLQGGLEAEDTRWMREGLRTLGVGIQEGPAGWRVEGAGRPQGGGSLWLGASGTTLRFLLPWVALCATSPVVMEGEARLFERPLAPLLEPLEALGAAWEPMPGGGRLTPCPQPPERLDLSVDASLSSQFLTGLLMAAAALPGGGTLRSAGAASTSYLDLTARWLRHFGCEVIQDGPRWIVPGQALRPVDITLPGDWSAAAAFLAAAAVTGRRLRLGPLDPEDGQGDGAMVGILARAGCAVHWIGPHTLELQGPLRSGIQADLTDCPDLGPVLAATAALAPGDSVLTGLHTLPLKECDRLDASAELVRWIGGQAEVVGDHTLRITLGTPAPNRPPFCPRNDHRMAFAAAVGGLRWGGELTQPGCVAKTYPGFWEDWGRLFGGPAA